MKSGSRRSVVVVCILLLSSLAFAAWDLQNSGVTGPLYSVHFPEGTQVGYVVGADTDSLGGEVGLVLKTTNGGDTWVTQNPGDMGALRSVYFIDNDIGYAVGEAGSAIVTSDGGANWTPMTVGGTDLLTYVSFPENGQTGFIGVYPRTRRAKAYKTTDGGATWTSVSVGDSLDWSTGCAFANDSTGAVLGKEGLVIMVGPDSSWYGDAQTNADLVAAAFSRDEPSRGYLVGNGITAGVIRFTDDGGVTPWDSVRYNWPTTAFYGLDVATPGAAYVCGTDGMILRSVDDRVFYATTAQSTAALYGLCLPNGADTGYAVGEGGVILKTTDGGMPFRYGVEEPCDGYSGRTEFRVLTNPARHCICFDSDAEANVIVYDALGRVVARQKATRGLNYLPLSKSGVYALKVGGKGLDVTQKVVVQR